MKRENEEILRKFPIPRQNGRLPEPARTPGHDLDESDASPARPGVDFFVVFVFLGVLVDTMSESRLQESPR